MGTIDLKIISKIIIFIIIIFEDNFLYIAKNNYSVYVMLLIVAPNKRKKTFLK